MTSAYVNTKLLLLQVLHTTKTLQYFKVPFGSNSKSDRADERDGSPTVLYFIARLDFLLQHHDQVKSDIKVNN